MLNTQTETKVAKPADLKPAASPKSETKPVEARVTLKAICNELKLDPRVSREKLRIAAREPKKYPELAKVHKPRTSWEWEKGSQAEKEARAALTA